MQQKLAEMQYEKFLSCFQRRLWLASQWKWLETNTANNSLCNSEDQLHILGQFVVAAGISQLAIVSHVVVNSLTE